MLFQSHKQNEDFIFQMFQVFSLKRGYLWSMRFLFDMRSFRIQRIWKKQKLCDLLYW
jgi:hypothetical protein